MRCENCGWENPNENSRCEKCGASLGAGSSPQHTVSTIADSGFDPKKTQKGCPECGYPIRPGDNQCPQCGNTIGGGASTVPDVPPPSPSPQPKPKPVHQGTVPPWVKPGDNMVGKKVVGFLVTYSHNRLGEFFPLYESRNFIGKDANMDIQITNDDSVSSKHLSILYRSVDSKFKFRDEQSTSGTFINGELIDEGELTNHDIISIGNTKLVLTIIPKMEN